MPKRQQCSPEVAALIPEVVGAGESMTPPITAGEMEICGGISPETLSRMKKLGRGDIAVINNLAAIVGLKLKLTTNKKTLESMLAGSYFDDCIDSTP